MNENAINSHTSFQPRTVSRCRTITETMREGEKERRSERERLGCVWGGDKPTHRHPSTHTHTHIPFLPVLLPAANCGLSFAGRPRVAPQTTDGTTFPGLCRVIRMSRNIKTVGPSRGMKEKSPCNENFM